MMSDYPPELKEFHTRTMHHVLLVSVIPALAGGWGFYRQEVYSADDAIQSALSWVFMGGIVLLMLMLFYKALVALPKCPKCNGKMKELETITITEKAVFNLKKTSQWRIVECPNCAVRYRIAGLSHG